MGLSMNMSKTTLLHYKIADASKTLGKSYWLTMTLIKGDLPVPGA